VWGQTALDRFDNPLIYSALRQWQNTLLHKPAAADNYFNVLCALLKFGVSRRKLISNYAIGIPDLYDIGRRAAIVWTIDEVELAVETANDLNQPTVGDAILLAFETGLRPQDLITACKDNVRPHDVTKRALKASRFGNRYFATIPRTEELDLVITRCCTRPRQTGVDTLLVTNEGLPFRDFQLENAVRQVRKACGIHHIDPITGERDEKHLHDLRGTFATRLLATTDLTDQEVADIMAWSPRWVANIRRVYVDDVAHLEAMGKRWQAAAASPQSCH
jgi:integrase